MSEWIIPPVDDSFKAIVDRVTEEHHDAFLAMSVLEDIRSGKEKVHSADYVRQELGIPDNLLEYKVDQYKLPHCAEDHPFLNMYKVINRSSTVQGIFYKKVFAVEYCNFLNKLGT